LAYCVVADVTAIVDTDMTSSEISDIIDRIDKWIDLKINVAGLDALILEDLSSFWSAFRVMLKDPNAQKIGEYSENRSKVLEIMERRLEKMLKSAAGGIAFRVGYEPIDGGGEVVG